jgi:hypothetical protein
MEWKNRKYYAIILCLLYIAPLIGSVLFIKSEICGLLQFELICFFLFITTSIIYYIREPYYDVKNLVLFIIFFFICIYVYANNQAIQLNDKLFFIQRETELNELVKEFESNKNISELKVLKNSEYNTINEEMLSENPNLLDSLDIDTLQYRSLKDKMLTVNVMEIKRYNNIIIIYRVISIWGDDGLLYFPGNLKAELNITLDKFYSYHRLNEKWYYWHDD